MQREENGDPFPGIHFASLENVGGFRLFEITKDSRHLFHPLYFTAVSRAGRRTNRMRALILIVAAENAQREFLGFDRTREISTKSAQEIAEAAKAWGQTDDITVVTVRRNA